MKETQDTFMLMLNTNLNKLPNNNQCQLEEKHYIMTKQILIDRQEDHKLPSWVKISHFKFS